MLTVVPNVMTAEEVAACRGDLEAAEWIDGRITAGEQSGTVKRNDQLHWTDPVARKWGDHIVDALGRADLFVSAALPHRTYPPLFNRYAGGQDFGLHVDNAIRPVRGAPIKVRTDLSATLFLADPASYDGGELVIETSFGAQAVKLAAGDLVLYPASSIHKVNPVTRGVRLAAFFWVQSMIRNDSDREILFDLDQSIQRLVAQFGNEALEVVRLTGIYHNLVRRWAET
jgi:PKHD-type hydroxylase